MFSHASSTHRQSFRDDLRDESSIFRKTLKIGGKLTGRLGVLTPDTEAPEVPETTVRTDLLQPLKVVTELRVHTVGQNLGVLAVNDIPLPVQEPRRDLELCGVLDDGNETLKLVGVELSSTTHVFRLCDCKT